MKNKYNIAAALLLALNVFTWSSVITGCVNPERTTLSTAKVEVTTVVSAMQAFVQYEKAHGASADLRRKVDTAYQRVRAANLTAEAAWLTYKSASDASDPATPKSLAIYQAALSAVAVASAELVQLINSLPQ